MTTTEPAAELAHLEAPAVLRHFGAFGPRAMLPASWALVVWGLPALIAALTPEKDPLMAMAPFMVLGWFSIVAPWILLRFMRTNWSTIASAYADGGAWLALPMMRYTRLRSFAKATVVTTPLMGAVMFGLGGVEVSLASCAVAVIDGIALGVAGRLTILSLATFRRSREFDRSFFRFRPGDPVGTPGIVALSRAARIEAVAGALLFACVAAAMALVVDTTMGAAATTAWAAFLLVPLAFVLTCGLLAPAWVSHQAMEERDELLARILATVHTTWASLEGQVAPDERAVLTTSLTEASAAATALGHSKGQASSPTDTAGVFLAAVPLAGQAVGLLLNGF